MNQLALEGFFGTFSWTEFTGWPRFVIDLVTVPIFSAIAGLITNWTGVIMLFAPVRFSGFYTPGAKTIFPFLPRILQVLPIWAPGGIVGFQGFIPARAEKMASLCCDKALLKLGNVKDFFQELDPASIAANVTVIAKGNLRQMMEEVMTTQHPQLWKDLSPQMRETLYNRLEADLPAIVDRTFDQIADKIDQLVDAKLMTVGYLRKNPEVLKDIIYGLGAPELKFMVKIGLLGAPMGLILALWLSFVHYSSEHAKHGQEFGGYYLNLEWMGFLNTWLHFFPMWLWVLLGAALIGIIVNIIAIKVVFFPGIPQPRYKYLWKQALFAKRQDQAAADFGHALAYKVITLQNLANELLHGPAGDKTQQLLKHVVSQEIDKVLGPMKAAVRVAVGTKEMDSLMEGAGAQAISFAPNLAADLEFNKRQAQKLDDFMTQKLRELPPDEFMDMLYSAIEQDAWLLYAHGGLLGIVVGAVHIAIFGA
ncbi:MAG: hypothetical protein LLG14_01100 [Nocardiaceae bacterium]|nr:hypothetical protein [Nocardiaceae bacterium]